LPDEEIASPRRSGVKHAETAGGAAAPEGRAHKSFDAKMFMAASILNDFRADQP
jgi:hypothetical protein